MAKGIRTTIVITSEWFPNKDYFPTEADLLEAAWHDAAIYQEDPGLFIQEVDGDARVEVSVALVEDK